MIAVTDLIPLDIPTDSSIDVTRQGAHFDNVSGIWYTEPRQLNEALRGYAYDTDAFNIVAPYCLVITSKMHCWSCHQPTRIHGVMFTRFIKQNQDGKDEAFHQMTIERILRANVRKVNKLFVSLAGNPADHAPKDVVRYLCDARFVMNEPEPA